MGAFSKLKIGSRPSYVSMNDSSVILAVNVMVFSTSIFLSWIEFNCNRGFICWKTLFPSNSRINLIPLSFWSVNAVNSKVPIVVNMLSMAFGIVSNTPCKLDTDPTM